MSMENITNTFSTLTILEEDEYLSQFVQTNDENECKKLYTQISVENQLIKLNTGLQNIEQLICHQIYENHLQLFKQITWIENLESIINEISSHIQNLQSSIELLNCKVTDLFIKVQIQVVILNRLHATCDLLRKIIRTQNLTMHVLKKDNITPNLILEIKELVGDKDLKKITFLSKYLIKLSNVSV